MTGYENRTTDYNFVVGENLGTDITEHVIK